MTPEIFALMELQGNIKIALMATGMREEEAGIVAQEALHTFATSNVIKQQYKDAYAGVLKENADEAEWEAQ